MYHRGMQLRWAVLRAFLIVLPASASANSVVPASPMTRDAVQVPLSFLSYERGTGLTEYAIGGGIHWGTWVLGGTGRYHQADKTENQLLHPRGAADAVELEVVLGNSGNLFSTVSLADLCRRSGMKGDECLFSDLDADAQELYHKDGPDVDAPMLFLLTLGGSYQTLTMRSPSGLAEQSKQLWGGRARLGLGGYLGEGLWGLSGGVASTGASPAQVSYCIAVDPASTAFACTPTYLSSYNRTNIVDARLEWRQALSDVNGSGALATNPVARVVFQHSERDDPETANDDTSFGLRYLDFELPIFYYLHRRESPGVYAGMRGILRWWQVDRPTRVELMGGFFVAVAYGGARQHSSPDRRREMERFGQCDRCTAGSAR